MKIPIISLLLLFGISVASAQVTMINVIGKMPKELVPYINDVQREELAHDAELRLADKQGRGAEPDTMLVIKNLFEGETGIDSISEDFVRIALNKATELQVRILAYNDTAKVLCVVKTINVPLKESEVAFYDADWKKINSDFGLPNNAEIKGLLDMFVLRPDTMSEREFGELCGYFDPVVTNVDASRNDGCLRFELEIPIVPSDKKDALKGVLRPVLFKWNGLNFKKC